MGQLQNFTTADNVTVRFTYSGNTGLVESREDTESSQQYEYNEVGHLAAVILTNGKRITLKDGDVDFNGKSVMVVSEDSTANVVVGDTAITVEQGNSQAKPELSTVSNVIFYRL